MRSPLISLPSLPLAVAVTLAVTCLDLFTRPGGAVLSPVDVSQSSVHPGRNLKLTPTNFRDTAPSQACSWPETYWPCEIVRMLPQLLYFILVVHKEEGRDSVPWFTITTSLVLVGLQVFFASS